MACLNNIWTFSISITNENQSNEFTSTQQEPTNRINLLLPNRRVAALRMSVGIVCKSQVHFTFARLANDRDRYGKETLLYNFQIARDTGPRPVYRSAIGRVKTRWAYSRNIDQ